MKNKSIIIPTKVEPTDHTKLKIPARIPPMYIFPLLAISFNMEETKVRSPSEITGVKSSNEYGSPWQVLDNSISRLVYKIARPLTMGRPVDYKKALLLASAFLFAVLAAGSILIKILIGLCAIIPF